MFHLAEDKRNHLHRLVFLPSDPRQEPGFEGEYVGQVDLYCESDVGDWPLGEDRPRSHFGVSGDGKTYWVAGSERELREAGFRPLQASVSFGFRTWAAYEEVCVLR